LSGWWDGYTEGWEDGFVDADDEPATIYHHVEESPRFPMILFGGVIVFCDPKGDEHIPRGWDKKWKIAIGVHTKRN